MQHPLKFFLVSLIAVSILSACASGSPVSQPSVPPTPPPFPSATPFPMPSPTASCLADEFLLISKRAFAKFQDIETRAGVTARIALTSVVGEMQEARRNYQELSAPVCALKLSASLVKMMGDAIDSYLLFMRGSEYEKEAAKKLSDYEDGIGIVADEIDNLQSFLGTPVLSTRTRIPTNTPIPPTVTVTPTRTRTPVPTPVVVGVGTRLFAANMGWKVSRVERVKTLTSSYAPDTRTAKGIYLVVILDLDWTSTDALQSYRSVLEFDLADANGTLYSFEGFPQAMVAEGTFLNDDPFSAVFYTRRNNPTPYRIGLVLHELIVFDVPDSNEALYFYRKSFQRLMIKVR